MGHVTWGVVIACGKDEQLTAGTDVGFLSIGTRPALTYSLLAYENCPDVDAVVVVVRKERMESLVSMVQMFGLTKVKKVVAGGTQRKGSLQAGLKALDDDVTVVSIHEASRPCLQPELLGETIKNAKRHGSGIAAVRVVEPVRDVVKGRQAVPRAGKGALWVVVKPQAYRRELLEKGLAAAVKKKKTLDDESDAFDLIQKPLHLVAAPSTNIRIHNPEDLALATCLLTRGSRG